MTAGHDRKTTGDGMNDTAPRAVREAKTGDDGPESILETINSVLFVLVLIAAVGFPWILVMLIPLDGMRSVLESSRPEDRTRDRNGHGSARPE